MLWKNIFSPTLVGIITSVLLVNSVTAEMSYQYHHRQYHPQSQRSPYYFPTQNYIAVPGRIVQQANEIPIASTRNTIPFRQLPLLRSYYELETEMSSSPPAEGDDAFEPPNRPMNPPPPPENEPEPPPMHPPPPPPPPDHHHKVVKHVSIHEPPMEFYSEDDHDGRGSKVKIIRPKMLQPEKHINIVFIKAPTPQKSKTEIILPDHPQQKTLVYVLVKKPDPMEGIRVRGPPPVEPTKPQVFFIRYKKNNKKDEYYHHEK